ncbi:MAG: hypothetical protein IJB89_00370 [Akkermansia sp.]|nr:hypothetical protein [Akkermansia sp.]
MNQQPPSHPDESVTTEPQRLALERMSAQLIHNLNVMIAEQEERVRIFAEQHHSPSPLPQHPTPEKLPEPPSVPPVPEPEPAKPLVAKFKAIARRNVPPLVTSSPNEQPQPQPRPIPVISTPRKTTESKEESSIGVGTIVTFIVIILFLLRACS